MITHWFAALPIDRKLVAIGLTVTTAALLAAMIGLAELIRLVAAIATRF